MNIDHNGIVVNAEDEWDATLRYTAERSVDKFRFCTYKFINKPAQCSYSDSDFRQLSKVLCIVVQYCKNGAKI